MDPFITPDTMFRVDFECFEMRMSHSVCSPRVTHVPSGEVLLDCFDTMEDGAPSVDEQGRLHMTMRTYPGSQPGTEIIYDARAGTVTHVVGGKSETFIHATLIKYAPRPRAPDSPSNPVPREGASVPPAAIETTASPAASASVSPPVNELAIDRRPLASRRWPIMHALAARAAAAGITPNGISLAGMAFGIGAGVLFGATSHVVPAGWGERALWIAGAAFVQLRLLCNLIDGMVAIEGGKRSARGEIYNEVPDRVSDAVTLIGAGYAAGSSPVLGCLAACLAIFVAYLRAVGKGAGMTSDYGGPMAKQQRMFVITLAAVLMAALPATWRPSPGMVLEAPQAGIMFVGLGVVIVGCLVTAVRRLAHLGVFLRERGVR